MGLDWCMYQFESEASFTRVPLLDQDGSKSLQYEYFFSEHTIQNFQIHKSNLEIPNRFCNINATDYPAPSGSESNPPMEKNFETRLCDLEIRLK